ncbi:MAG: hypothetical protein MZV63_72565 [Marinilabiliales bacterium]|nr:hypothetical protein [Marinilabiliales bacterium]
MERTLKILSDIEGTGPGAGRQPRPASPDHCPQSGRARPCRRMVSPHLNTALDPRHGDGARCIPRAAFWSCLPTCLCLPAEDVRDIDRPRGQTACGGDRPRQAWQREQTRC